MSFIFIFLVNMFGFKCILVKEGATMNFFVKDPKNGGTTPVGVKNLKP